MDPEGEFYEYVDTVDSIYQRRMDNSTECLDMNAELWLFRNDYTTLPITMAIFACLYFTIIVFGVTGNICVILAIARTRSLQTVPNMFIFSLSCSDLVVCCLSATITPITALKKEWLFGNLMCTIAPWLAGISLCFSTFTLTAISIDRYILIKYPMKKPLSKPQALCIIAGIVVAAAVICSPTALKQKLTPFENFCGEYCTEDWGPGDQHERRLYGALLLTVQLIVPLTIIIISYTAISLRIGQSMILKGTTQPRKGSPTSEWQSTLTDQQRIALKRRQRTNRMLIGMVVAFSASWCWSVTYNLCRDYDMLPSYIVDQEYLFGVGTHCIAMTSTLWNPLLYALLNLQLRHAFIQLIPDKLRHWLGVTYDEKSTHLVNGGVSEHPGAKSFNLSRPSPHSNGNCLGANAYSEEPSSRAGAKYGATAQTVVNGHHSAALSNGAHFSCPSRSNSTSQGSRASVKQRKPSAIRVIVSRLSASFGESEGPLDDEIMLLETTTSSSDDDIRRPRLDSPPSTLGVIGVIGAVASEVAAPRRASTASVRVQRALTPTSIESPLHLVRVNSF